MEGAFMRSRRFQKPSVRNKGGYWIAQYRDLQGTKRKVSLGPVKCTKKIEAEQKLQRILEPINSAAADPQPDWTLGQFVRQVYLPFYRRKWKGSTAATNIDRLERHVLPLLGERPLKSFRREEFQSFLDDKTASGLSFSMVAHFRWDFRQIFRMAVNEGALLRNPADLLFVPREAPHPSKRVMTFDEARLFFSVLALRERVIGGLALLGGMRPGEIFALRRADLEKGYANIQQAVYRGRIDTPKTNRSKRWAALGPALNGWIKEWLALSVDDRPDAWLFPSERRVTPLAKDNCWRRHFKPQLEAVQLGWVNFQILRRSHSTLMQEVGVDPQVRADQMGHSIDVNQNQYTQTSLARREAGVTDLARAIGVM
jgi:integrase